MGVVLIGGGMVIGMEVAEGKGKSQVVGHR
jgi:hypothetical protein